MHKFNKYHRTRSWPQTKFISCFDPIVQFMQHSQIELFCLCAYKASHYQLLVIAKGLIDSYLLLLCRPKSESVFLNSAFSIRSSPLVKCNLLPSSLIQMSVDAQTLCTHCSDHCNEHDKHFSYCSLNESRRFKKIKWSLTKAFIGRKLIWCIYFYFIGNFVVLLVQRTQKIPIHTNSTIQNKRFTSGRIRRKKLIKWTDSSIFNAKSGSGRKSVLSTLFTGNTIE